MPSTSSKFARLTFLTLRRQHYYIASICRRTAGPISEFSTTRAADFATAETNNSHLGPAIAWLRANTPLVRLSDLETYETILNATANGGFTITFNSNSIP